MTLRECLQVWYLLQATGGPTLAYKPWRRLGYEGPVGNFECGGSTPLSSGEAWLAGASDYGKFTARRGRLALSRKLASGTVLKVGQTVQAWSQIYRCHIPGLRLLAKSATKGAVAGRASVRSWRYESGAVTVIMGLLAHRAWSPPSCEASYERRLRGASDPFLRGGDLCLTVAASEGPLSGGVPEGRGGSCSA